MEIDSFIVKSRFQNSLPTISCSTALVMSQSNGLSFATRMYKGEF